MTRALDILKLMTDGEMMTSARASAACGCELKAAQNTLWFLSVSKFVVVETRAGFARMAEYRITPLGVKRSKFQPKVNGETESERSARQERTERLEEAALDALDRQRAQQEARAAVFMASSGAIANSVFALGSMS